MPGKWLGIREGSAPASG